MDSETPILDLLLDRERLRDRLVEAARREMRHRLADQVLKNVVAPRIDELVGRVRRR